MIVVYKNEHAAVICACACVCVKVHDTTVIKCYIFIELCRKNNEKNPK